MLIRKPVARRAAPGSPSPTCDQVQGRPGQDYTVVGKGDLVRIVRLPDRLAERLEAHRLDESIRVTDRSIHYLSLYEFAVGTN